MKHIDGISVSLRLLNEELIKEYDNGVEDEPHPNFDGSIATRQIAVREGTHVEAIITIDESFNLYTADGIWIEVYAGSLEGSLRAGELGQCWWVDARREGVSGSHKVSFWSTFGNRCEAKMIRFLVPRADKGECNC